LKGRQGAGPFSRNGPAEASETRGEAKRPPETAPGPSGTGGTMVPPYEGDGDALCRRPPSQNGTIIYMSRATPEKRERKRIVDRPLRRRLAASPSVFRDHGPDGPRWSRRRDLQLSELGVAPSAPSTGCGFRRSRLQPVAPSGLEAAAPPPVVTPRLQARSAATL
jgi:hypothetical protein